MSEVDLKKFGKRLKELRLSQNLTQAQLAEKMGLSTNFIGMVERGERNTTIDKLFKISFALDISLEKMFKNL